MKRRQLLQAVAAGWLVDQCLPQHPHIVGRIVGASHRVGHLLRGNTNKFTDTPAETADVVVVGSGISGASAAWRLAALGIKVLMLELEPRPGGTSTWSEDGAVAHPWGAHYLPVPEADASAVQRLLKELGIITGWDAASRPLLQSQMLCHAPEERLHFRGAWHSGIVPYGALSSHERAEVERFRGIQHQLRHQRGSDGRYAFALPNEYSSRDAAFLELDRMSMAQWLKANNFKSDFLRWYVEYATLDDFGASLEEVSAWAAFHYFAARRLETEQTEGSRYLVWPEGNGFLARALLEKMHGERRHGALVTQVSTRSKGRNRVTYVDVGTGERKHVDARGVVLAIPSFLVHRIVNSALTETTRASLPRRESSPWLVANLHVHRPPKPNHAWDSMLYGSRGLGYVDAGHQRTLLEADTVLTYFRAFGGPDASASRRFLLQQSWTTLASDILDDLLPSNPDIAESCSRLDVMLWGHAMPRPRPGFLGEKPFAQHVALAEGITWAHVDQSGMALFEEANLRGVRAAEVLAKSLGVDPGESWV